MFEQGFAVDSIESSVEQTSVYVSDGTEQLRKAGHYKSQVRRKKLLIATVLIAIVFLFLIVLSITN